MNELILSLALTAHLSVPGELNNIHPHIGYRHNEYTVGAYYNSYRKTSYYVSRSYAIANGSVDVGLASGYQFPVAPMLRLNRHLDRGVKLFLLPSYDTNAHQLGAVFGVEFPLK